MSQTLKPWYAVATPHEDIREGRLAEAVFAASLWAVVQGTAPEVYLDPEEFFRKTYLTTGLSTVPNRVAGALRRGGESGDRIISLQTVFGGGKTHTPQFPQFAPRISAPTRAVMTALAVGWPAARGSRGA
jgi:hypothetical protein